MGNRGEGVSYGHTSWSLSLTGRIHDLRLDQHCLYPTCRMESDEDSDSPDSIVPASSPESILGEEAPRFPQLGSGRWEQDNRALSPVIPIIPRTGIPGVCCSLRG